VGKQEENIWRESILTSPCHRTKAFQDGEMSMPPKFCPHCKIGVIVSTKRYGEKTFTDKCSNCGRIIVDEYKIES
jgi:rRNA maturation protein Nop10